MIFNLKMCRFENVPWGFRLIGGSDYDIPLTVVKVTEGSIAELAGMKVDDVIVRINEESTSQLSHNDAHDVIKNAGNNFFFGIFREEISDEETNDTIVENVDQDAVSPSNCIETMAISEKNNEVVEENQHYAATDELQEKVTDEEIAELISGEAEVLKDHNVIGVNFNRIFPKPGVCMSSQVLRQLNDEAMKTKSEMEKEKRKWTTFMQKPDRPIPKSKKELEEERIKKENAYKVIIMKQPKPKIAPDHVPTPPASPEPIVDNPEKEAVDDQLEDEDEIKPLADSELPDLEPVRISPVADLQENTDNGDENCDNVEAVDIEPQEESIEEQFEAQESPDEIPVIEKIEKTEEELALEKQLADVQKQLLALSSLPSTIQATLDAVTKQLADILPSFKLQNSTTTKTDDLINNDEEIADNNDNAEKEFQSIIEKIENTNDENNDEQLSVDEVSEKPENIEVEESEAIHNDEIISDGNTNEETNAVDEELNYKKQKDNDLMVELQQRITNDRTNKKQSNRSFGPLVPQQRPLILPGGRRWRTPKDAFNEDFIAETLSSQAELIVGHTLGSTFESPHLPYDRDLNSASLAQQLQNKVNFLKYQKPEKKIDLAKSEVYKVVHHLEKLPKHGIEIRPPKVLAEEDIRKSVNTCG